MGGSVSKLRTSRKGAVLLAAGVAYGTYLAWNMRDALHKRSVYDVCPYQLALFRAVPLGLMTRLAGNVAALHVPGPLRRPLYGAFATVYGCDLSECAELASFPTFNAFFTRSLRDGARTIDAGATLVSPVDGRLYSAGRLEVDGTHGRALFPSAIKGLRYPLDRLLGLAPGTPIAPAAPGRATFYAAIYLSPGAYHRFHAPADEWRVTDVRRVPGEALPVAPWIMRRMPGLPAVNERAVLDGRWGHGRMTMVPVGATNVRSITLANKLSAAPRDGASLAVGEEVGRFEMGSLVVLVFDAPESFVFAHDAGTDVRLGEALGSL